MSRDRGKPEEKVNKNINDDESKNLEEGKGQKDEIKSFSGKVKTINLNLVIPNISRDKLIEIKNKGTKSVFLKSVLGSDYQSKLDISSISNKLFEYPVSQIMIGESSFVIKSYIYVVDPEKFLVKTIGIYWVDEKFLGNEKYQEILLGFYSQEDFFLLENAKQIDLTLTINY
ncbi:hypothetical protein [Rickettsiella massiliensis]|uniref:hypothetical protein n=1 Tax=Rickettsiella massiliensis TaxID=676517 RepID=UPI000299E5CE|nr:hypothetical protein [Rickettsiella massiliensis]